MQQVMAGNLNAEIATTDSKDEISSLSRTFNNMVTEIGHLIEEIQVTQKRETSCAEGKCFWPRSIPIFSLIP